MPISKLGHYSINTLDLERSERFYVDILGFRLGYRPPFDFPGRWLYRDDDESDYGIVHLVGIDPANSVGLQDYLGNRGAAAAEGTGCIDHVAFLATDWAQIRRRCDEAGHSYVTRVIPSLGLLQVFIDDPSGITVELNFPASEA